jgi:hypothetical protein
MVSSGAAAGGLAGVTSSSGGGGVAGGAAGENVVWFASPAAKQKVMAALPQEIGEPVGKAVDASNGTDIQVKGFERVRKLLWSGSEWG